MRSMKRWIIIILILFNYSCMTNKSDKNDISKTVDTTSKDTITIYKYINNPLFDKLPHLVLPLHDTLNGYNVCKRRHKINMHYFQRLQLRKIIPHSSYIPSDTAYSFVGQLDISNDYYSVIVNVLAEMFTDDYLINYDHDFNVLGIQHIAADEWAEHYSYTNSVIKTDTIEIHYYSCIDTIKGYVPTYETVHNVKINKDGSFTKIK